MHAYTLKALELTSGRAAEAAVAAGSRSVERGRGPGPPDRMRFGRSQPPTPEPYSVETDGSVCSCSGTDITKCDAGSAASCITRSASSSWPVARSSSA
jgi:hypothetical protein